MAKQKRNESRKEGMNKREPMTYEAADRRLCLLRNHGYVWKQEIHDDLCRTLEGNVHIGCLLPHRTRNNKKNQAAIHTAKPTQQTNLF